MNAETTQSPDSLGSPSGSGLWPCPFCGFEEPSMGIDRTVTCGNCGAKGPWDRDAYDGAGDEQEMWNHRRRQKLERRPESPETDQLMQADRHHWENNEEVSITAYMRMFALARELEEERDAYRRAYFGQNVKDQATASTKL